MELVQAFDNLALNTAELSIDDVLRDPDSYNFDLVSAHPNIHPIAAINYPFLPWNYEIQSYHPLLTYELAKKYQKWNTFSLATTGRLTMEQIWDIASVDYLGYACDLTLDVVDRIMVRLPEADYTANLAIPFSEISKYHRIDMEALISRADCFLEDMTVVPWEIAHLNPNITDSFFMVHRDKINVSGILHNRMSFEHVKKYLSLPAIIVHPDFSESDIQYTKTFLYELVKWRRIPAQWYLNKPQASWPLGKLKYRIY